MKVGDDRTRYEVVVDGNNYMVIDVRRGRWNKVRLEMPFPLE